MVCPEIVFTRTPLLSTSTQSIQRHAILWIPGLELNPHPQSTVQILILACFEFTKCFLELEVYEVHNSAAVSTEPSSQRQGEINPRENKLNRAAALRLGPVACPAAVWLDIVSEAWTGWCSPVLPQPWKPWSKHLIHLPPPEPHPATWWITGQSVLFRYYFLAAWS